MSTTDTPTPTPSAPSPNNRAGSLVVAIVTLVVGSAVILGTLFAGVLPTYVASLARDEVSRVSAAGATKVVVESGAASLTVRFGEVEEAILDVRDVAAGAWTLRRDGGTIVVASPRTWFLSWFSGGNGGATLTLPRSLERSGIDADLDLGAGDLTVQGTFGVLDAEVGAGALTVAGSARSLSLDLSAGRADLDLRDVRTATLDVSAGTIEGSLTGTPPETVALSASAGSIDLGLPDVVYDVRTDASAGSIDNGLQTSRSAARTIGITVSAGRISVQPLPTPSR